jgi:SAM-dependent methyltransferase
MGLYGFIRFARGIVGERGRKSKFKTSSDNICTHEGVWHETKFIEIDERRYYLKGERYDWVEDPRGLEKVFHRLRLIFTRRWMPSTFGWALDAGCGTGLITRELRARKVVGLDLDRWNIERAKKRVPYGDFVKADVNHLPFRDGSMSIVFFTEVLEHVSTALCVLLEANRVLRWAGIITGSVPSRSLFWNLRFLSVTHGAREPFHLNYSGGRLRYLLDLADFRLIEVRRGNLGMNLFFTALGRGK